MKPTAAHPLMPSSALPAAYYALAHAGFALALLTLVVDPSLPGASFSQPRLVALVHLLTLAWISGSILGSLYIVGPLALRIPMVARKADWIAFGCFAAGTLGMVSHFWINTYEGMTWSAGLVSIAVVRVGWRLSKGVGQSTAPGAVLLHVGLAFVNLLLAAGLGILIGLNRSRGFMEISPLSVMFTHAHLAAIGWAGMMVVGLSYRLIPMMLPAAMPTGRSLALSAILLEGGLLVLAITLISASDWVLAGTLLIVAGLVSFVVRIRLALRHRMPRPPALPRRDWSTWQTHGAFLWLMVAAALGVTLSTDAGGESRLTLMWIYGVAGLVGFLGQIVAGIQGRLVPLYAWYLAFAAKSAPPERGANELPTPRFAFPILIAWSIGVPLLAWGISAATEWMIRLAALSLLVALTLGAAYLIHMIRSAQHVST